MKIESENEFVHISRNFIVVAEGLTRQLVNLNGKPIDEKDVEAMREIVREIKKRASSFLRNMEKFEGCCDDD